MSTPLEHKGREGAVPSHRLTMTVDEAAAALGVGRGLAYEMVRQGRIPALRLGRRVVVPVAGLRTLLAASGEHQGAEDALKRSA